MLCNCKCEYGNANVNMNKPMYMQTEMWQYIMCEQEYGIYMYTYANKDWHMAVYVWTEICGNPLKYNTCTTYVNAMFMNASLYMENPSVCMKWMLRNGDPRTQQTRDTLIGGLWKQCYIHMLVAVYVNTMEWDTRGMTK